MIEALVIAVAIVVHGVLTAPREQPLRIVEALREAPTALVNKARGTRRSSGPDEQPQQIGI